MLFKNVTRLSLVILSVIWGRRIGANVWPTLYMMRIKTYHVCIDESNGEVEKMIIMSRAISFMAS